jgi:hypothetical protein
MPKCTLVSGTQLACLIYCKNYCRRWSRMWTYSCYCECCQSPSLQWSVIIIIIGFGSAIPSQRFSDTRGKTMVRMEGNLSLGMTDPGDGGLVPTKVMHTIGFLDHDNMGISRCNHISILPTSWVMSISSLKATILYFWTILTPNIIADCVMGLLDPESVELAVGIMCLACLEAKIRWGYFYTPPSSTLVRIKGLATRGLSI